MVTPPFKDDTLLARWLSGELSADEAQALRNRPDFVDYERLVEGLEKMAPPVFDEEAEFVKLKSVRANRRSTRAQQPALHPRPRLIRRMLPWSAAAAVALLLVAWFLLPSETSRFMAENGDSAVIAELNDGSTARLNAGSDLTFSITDDARMAGLNGEAYFEVEKSSVPFVVKTSLGEVWVLGTSFNVYNRNQKLTVSCTTGKVSVRFVGDATDYPITPGQSVGRKGTGQIERSDTTTADQLDWLSGKSVFINRPLVEILDELERQYGLVINRPAALNQEKNYTVTFENNDLELALATALGPVEGFEFVRKDREVTFVPTE